MTRFFLALAAVALLGAAPAAAAADSPVGTWRTIDDATGQTKSIVEITEVGGMLEGKVLKVLQSDQGENPVCSECSGDRHNQPIEGMTILWGLAPKGDEWSGGQILDPANGKTYKCKLATIEDGAKLKVRGYIGFSLMGRSQVWERVEETAPETATEAASAPVPAAGEAPAPAAEPATDQPATDAVPEGE